MAGIGGTGVVTVAQILSTAAMFDGWEVRGLDQTGLSQKAGPVISDVVLARNHHGSSNLVGDGQAELILAFDAMVAAGDGAIAAADPERTAVIASVAPDADRPHDLAPRPRVPDSLDRGPAHVARRRRNGSSTPPGWRRP